MFEYFLYYLAINVYSSLITWKFFLTHNKPAWAAWVPFYRTYVLTQVADRPKWWAILCYIPVIDNVMSVILTYELLHMHGYQKNKHIFLSVFSLGLYLGYLNYTAKLTPAKRDNEAIRRRIPATVNHILFAVVAAGAIRMTTFEAYNIPTGSMEKTLMVGDYLFVSKMHYGLRLPNTPLSIPLVHNLVPFTSWPSYLDWLQLPYFRLPGWTSPQKGDAVVFNYPGDDPDRPVDKKENYVKQCVGTPGDTLIIKDRVVYTNGNAEQFGDRSNPQWNYYVRVKKEKGINPELLKRDFDINYVPQNQAISDIKGPFGKENREFIITISNNVLDRFSGLEQIDTLYPINVPSGDFDTTDRPKIVIDYINSQKNLGFLDALFPNPTESHDPAYFPWTLDNYGPIWIPEKGKSVDLNYENVLKYKRAITLYEGHTLDFKNGIYFVDGQQADSYTFEMDYYWMMGDNRHNSLDSRFWGFVPEDHIVGKPVFIFFSTDQFVDGFLSSKRWERFLTVVHGKGNPVSYLWPFIALVGLYYGWGRYKKRKGSK